jgi:anaerobic selenocysteine-containing dehydrogenase
VMDGDAVEVFNARGRIALHARIGEMIPQGVVAARLDWNKLSGENGHSGSNVNALTSETLTDMGGGPTFYSTLVEVRKAD